MEITYEEALLLFQNYKLDKAKELLEELLTKDSQNLVKINILLGKINAKSQNYGDALNCFNNALELEPSNEQAKTGLQLTQNILQLTNNLYFENAYTDDDLYDF